MENKQAYFSIVQYSEYPERGEFLNVGLVLFSKLSPNLIYKFVRQPNRLERTFKVPLGVHFSRMVSSLENRLQTEFSQSWSHAALENFIEMRSGKMRFLPPRSVYCESPSDLLSELFAELVQETPRKVRNPRVSTLLKKVFLDQNVEHLLQNPDPVDLPQGVQLKAPYAYQNGSYNLIKALSLRDEPDSALKMASSHAWEGEWLFNSTATSSRKKLVIVADLSGQREPFKNAVAQKMNEANVVFYDLEQVTPLVVDIRKNVQFQNNSSPVTLHQ